MAINPMDYIFHFPLSAKKIVAPHELTRELSFLLRALQQHDLNHPMAALFQNKKKICLLIGALAWHHPDAAVIRSLLRNLAVLSGASINVMTDGPNTAGGWLAGAIPHRQAGSMAIHHIGLSAHEMLVKPRKAYLLLNVEPDLDCANAKQAKEAMKQASCVIALSLYRNTVLDAHADVILPMTPFTETSGTFINAEGVWQSFLAVANPYESARPAWKILQALGNCLQLPGFEYPDTPSIKQEVEILTRAMPSFTSSFSEWQTNSSSVSPNTLTRIGEIPIYATDSLVRHAEALQEAQSVMQGELAAVRIHPATAKQLALQDLQLVKLQQDGTAAVNLPVMIDERVPLEAAWVPGGILATAELGSLFGNIEIKKA
jgi:NADH-quinone oxidoreductase subunit G